jgi:1,4-dihydroxy-2-naphthoate octaprenyltransferase
MIVSNLEVLKIWWLTLRPKTLTATIVPVFVGSALAWAERGFFSAHLAFCCLSFGLCVQIATNLFNDVEDWKRNADGDKRLGPKRAIQLGVATPWAVMMAAIMLLAMALLFAIPMVLHGGSFLWYLVGVSFLCAYCYTGGPYPLAYCGFGELFVIIFFGFAATIVPFYLQTGTISFLSAIAGMQLGLLATVLIAINNLRDREEDSSHGKNTLAVRFDRQFALAEIAFCCYAPFFLLPLWFVNGYRLAALLPLILVPFACRLVVNISTTLPGPIYNTFLAKAAALHLLFGLALVLGSSLL